MAFSPIIADVQATGLTQIDGLDNGYEVTFNVKTLALIPASTRIFVAVSFKVKGTDYKITQHATDVAGAEIKSAAAGDHVGVFGTFITDDVIVAGDITNVVATIQYIV